MQVNRFPIQKQTQEVANNPNSRFTPEQKEKLAKAARDFETMMTSMMVKSMFENNSGMFGEESNSGASMFDGFFINELSAKMSQGNLGIAQSIYQNMTGEKLPDNPFYRRIVEFRNEIGKMQQETPIEKSLSYNNPLKVNNNIDVNPVRPSTTAMNRLSQYDSIIKQAAIKYNVDENLIRSVILAESAANKNAVSSAKAKGLMQLMDGTARDMGVRNPFDPQENIMGGTKYLAYLIDKFDGDMKKVVAAYNAGPGNVEKYDGIPPFRETKQYVNRVLAYYNHLTGEQNEDA